MLQEFVEQLVGVIIGFINRFLVDGPVEAEQGAKTLAKRWNVVRQTHGSRADDSKFRGDCQHGLGLSNARARPVAFGRRVGRIVRPRHHDVGVNIDEMAGIAEMAAVGVVDAGDVKFGRRGHDLSPHQ